MSENDTPAKPARKPGKTAAKKVEAADATAKSENKPKARRSRTKRAGTGDAASTQAASTSLTPAAPHAAQDDRGHTRPASLIRVAMPVRWRDLDAFNHVNNSKYLSYLEEARLHWMIGVPGQGMDDHVAPVVASHRRCRRRQRAVLRWPRGDGLDRSRQWRGGAVAGGGARGVLGGLIPANGTVVPLDLLRGVGAT